MLRTFPFLTVALAIAAAAVGASSPALAQPSVSTSSAPAAAPKQQEIPELREALTLLNQGQFEKSLEKLGDVSRQHPEFPSRFVLMYGILAQNNQANAARAMLDRAAVETPSDPEPWVIFGNMALQDSRLAESELDFAKAISLLANYKNTERKGAIEQQSLSGMVAISERRERWADAEARLDKFLAAEPKDLMALQRRARAKFWQMKVEEALDDLKKAKQIDLQNVANDKTGKAREQMLPAFAVLRNTTTRMPKPRAKANPRKPRSSLSSPWRSRPTI